MLIFALPLFFGTFVFAACILVIYHHEFQRLRLSFLKAKSPRITELPIITPTGQIVNTIEELDMHLECLRNELEEKKKKLENSKNKVGSTEDNLKRLTNTMNEVKKFYFRLKTEIVKIETDCKELKYQIEDCVNRQGRLRDEVDQNVKYYSHILGNMDNDTVKDDSKDYELVKATPKENVIEYS